MKQCNKSEFSRFDRKIREAEEAELKRMQASEDTLENYFESKRRKELSQKNLKDMSWQEVEELAKLRKASADIDIRKNASENEFQEPEDMQREIMKMCDACEAAASKSKPDLVESFQKLRKLLIKSELGISNIPRESAASEEEEISDESPVFVSKNLSMTKSKSGKILVSGFSTIQELDKAGDVLPITLFEPLLKEFFMNDAKICIDHNINNVVGKLRSYDIRKNSFGKDGIFVTCEIFESYVEKLIMDKKLTGFSYSFHANREKACEKNTCYGKLIPSAITELSLCEVPMNGGSKITSMGYESYGR